MQALFSRALSNVMVLARTHFEEFAATDLFCIAQYFFPYHDFSGKAHEKKALLNKGK